MHGRKIEGQLDPYMLRPFAFPVFLWEVRDCVRLSKVDKKARMVKMVLWTLPLKKQDVEYSQTWPDKELLLALYYLLWVINEKCWKTVAWFG